MNKIYYLQQEVKLNDEIDFKGLKIKLTQEIIDNNPNLFTVKEIIEFPEYVECVSNYMVEDKLNIGKIYKTYIIINDSKFGIYYNYSNDDYFLFYNVDLFNQHFKPSTKEQFEKQNKIESIIEEAKIKFPIGSKFKQGNFKFIVYENLMGNTYKYDDLGFICVFSYNEQISEFEYISLYNFQTEIWAEPIEKEFEDYKQELLNEVPYNYLYNNNPKLFYFELLNRICKDLNKDWVYENGSDFYFIYWYIGNLTYTSYKNNKGIPSHISFKLSTKENAEKLIKLTPNSVLDLLFKS